MNMRFSKRDGSRSGQAMVEMAIGLIGLIVVIGAALQFGRLCHEQTLCLHKARAEAGQFSMGDNYASQGPAASFIYDWNEGVDGVPYSHDDKPILAGSDAVSAALLDPARPDLLKRYIPTNMISALHDTAGLIAGFDLVHGKDKSDDIPLYPVVRHLIYDSDTMQVDADAYLTWARHIE